MVKIQNWNGQHGMYAGHIAALRRLAKITMQEISEIAGCSIAQYSAYEHERRKFDPEVYQKCIEYIERVMKANRSNCGQTLDCGEVRK